MVRGPEIVVVPVGFKQARSARTRAKLAASARELFVTNAYEAVTIKAVAARAGYATSVIYNYWHDKASLWSDVMGCEPPVDSTLVRQASKLAVGHDKLIRDLSDLLVAIESGQSKAQLRAKVQAMLEGQSEVFRLPVEGPDPVREVAPDTEIDPYESAATIGARLRAIRLERGVPQIELARVLSVSIQTVSRYERAMSQIPAASLGKLAERLGCTLEQLVEGAD